MKEKIKIYLWLLYINMFISAFTFGGGYVVVPMINSYFVEKKELFTYDELLNMAVVAQSSPGAIAINLSALAGYRVAAIPGMILSCIGGILPPLIILCIVSSFYNIFTENWVIIAMLKGMEAGVSAIIVSLVMDMSTVILKKKSIFLSMIIPISFILNYVFNINVAIILFFCCGISLLRVYLNKRGILCR